MIWRAFVGDRWIKCQIVQEEDYCTPEGFVVIQDSNGNRSVIDQANVSGPVCESKLAECRKDAGMSQRELCDLAGISRATLQHLESGGDWKYSFARRVATVLGVKISDIWPDCDSYSRMLRSELLSLRDQIDKTLRQ